MHELSICQALVAKVEHIALPRRARVLRLRIGVGPLSGVEPRLIESAWPLACTGTAAEGSLLDIEMTDIRIRCRDCGAESAAAANRLTCPACESWHTGLVSGDELNLLRVELETPDEVETSRV
jgi:hydrogenase nickel incorporation protein HypA/HybF